MKAFNTAVLTVSLLMGVSALADGGKLEGVNYSRCAQAMTVEIKGDATAIEMNDAISALIGSYEVQGEQVAPLQNLTFEWTVDQKLFLAHAQLTEAVRANAAYLGYLKLLAKNTGVVRIVCGD